MWRAALVLFLLAAACGAAPQRDDDGPTSKPVDISQFPWLVLVQGKLGENDKVEYGCFGSIVSPTWVLTAAECTASAPHWLSVRAGTSSLDTDGVVYDVANIIQHEDYDNTTKDYNFALIETSEPISFGSNVQAVVLGSSNITLGTEVTVVGWFGYSEQLRAANTSIVDGWRKAETIIFTAAVDGCMGPGMFDTGAPLVVGNTQYGVAMFNGPSCNDTKIYSYVPAVRSWITDKTGVLNVTEES